MKRKEVGFRTEKKGKFRQLFPKITESDLYFQEGQERRMIEMLGNKLGKTTQELLSIIIEL
ncbi:MAG TPA: general stress protein CsbD [Bacteroidales bacterium]|nr:general stress protein CsbD [Bacteroidales bacterium]HBQ83736.1 general stress protein CsbD [Bacteroidales bacterium]HCU20195.1 general stress protein CsbD [Bacteroidales bacterium]